MNVTFTRVGNALFLTGIHIFYFSALVLQVGIIVIGHHLTGHAVVINRHLEGKLKRQFEVLILHGINQKGVRNRHEPVFTAFTGSLGYKSHRFIAEMPVCNFSFPAEICQLSFERCLHSVVEARAGLSLHLNPGFVAEADTAFFINRFRHRFVDTAVGNLTFDHFRQFKIILVAGSQSANGKSRTQCDNKPKFVRFHIRNYLKGLTKIFRFFSTNFASAVNCTKYPQTQTAIILHIRLRNNNL